MNIRMGALIIGFAATFSGRFVESATAQANSATPAPSTAVSILGTSVRSGIIIMMNATRMVVLRKHKGKTEQLELVVNSATALKGDLAVGSQVVVHYRTENRQNIATSIQTRKALQFERDPTL